MTNITFNVYWWPSTVTAADGESFHPALRSRKRILYWANVREDTEAKAYERARLALKDAFDAAEAVARSWNLTSM